MRSMRSNLLPLEAAVLGRRCISGDEPGDVGNCALVGSNPKDDESDDTRESAGMSGDRGGAKPVTQSMIKVLGGRRGADGDSILAVRPAL